MRSNSNGYDYEKLKRIAEEVISSSEDFEEAKEVSASLLSQIQNSPPSHPKVAIAAFLLAAFAILDALEKIYEEI